MASPIRRILHRVFRAATIVLAITALTDCYNPLGSEVACRLGATKNCPSGYVCRSVGTDPMGRCCLPGDPTCGLVGDSGVTGNTGDVPVTTRPDGASAVEGGPDVAAPGADSGPPDLPAATGGGDGGWDTPIVVSGGVGGTSANGGAAGAGGVTGSGGVLGGGGATGGSRDGGLGAGGSTVAGSGGIGIPGTGGIAPTTGGATGTGGRTGTGGISSTGGATIPGTGGVATTGGTSGTGGLTSTGGNPGTGGTSTGGTPGGSVGCGRVPTIPSSQYNTGAHIAITAAGKARAYILRVPSNYDNSHPYKLVIAFHQADGTADQMYSQNYYQLLPLANDTTIFVAPHGQSGGVSCAQASGCGWPNTGDTDLALVDAVVAEIEANFCVDTNRIFATGWSYGASMAYKTACERPLAGGANGYIRAVAAYSGAQLSGTCTPTKPVAYYTSHGTGDTVINYNSGVGLAQNFAAANGCVWTTPAKAASAHVCTILAGCTTGYPLEFCSFVGDHTPYPDNGSASSSWSPAEVWKFLSQF